MSTVPPRAISPRSITRADQATAAPRYVVWELTMRCDHACAHCGSRAVKARPDELSDAQLFDTADQLIEMGAREVTLIGGEAYLHPRCNDIVRRLKAGGVRVTMQTGGRGLEPHLAGLIDAGLDAVGVSIDGPRAVHDKVRAAPGSHAMAMRALRAAIDAHMVVTVNTQVNRLSAPHLREVGRAVEREGVLRWRMQLTVPMGRAADRPDWILEPWQVVEVVDTLADFQREVAERARAAGVGPDGFLSVQIANNLGYYGPHEATLRSIAGSTQQFWKGCQAGRHTLGIESDGDIKGCPSLPTAPYVGGNMKTDRLADVWRDAPELRFVRERTVDELWGFCRTCYYAEECGGGCNFTAHCTLGRRGNNPFCYHRAATLKRAGRRERLEHREAPAGVPYDFGRFEIVEEDWPTG
ncbi:MAG: radical SAM protein [Alphaproteobacteria bacterium]|nr:radical SAM protein [Alphaproteobacteria bacterium]